MIGIFIVFLVFVCIILVAIILMQSSKGSGLVGPIAGTGVTTMFGARRASDFLSKATVVLAVVFMLFSLLMNIYISRSGASSEGKESNIQSQGRQINPGAPVQMPGDNQQQNQQEGQPNQNSGEGNTQNPNP